MADAITIKALQDASLDAKSLEEVVNGDDTKQVTTRLGETYPSVKKAIKTLFENGGLPAVPFATKALMTASSLANDKYAMVTNDTTNNGLYVKTAGAWVKSGYDPLAQAKADATTKADAAVVIASTNADTKIAAALTKSSGTFDTLAQLTASPLIDGAFALVANDTPAKNGHYKKVSGTWTKAGYDPVELSKDYTNYKTEFEAEKIKPSILTSENILDKSKLINNVYISATDGTEKSATGFSVSPYIPVEGSAKYSTAQSRTKTYQYTADKVFISSFTSGENTADNTRFLRLSFETSYTDMVNLSRTSFVVLDTQYTETPTLDMSKGFGLVVEPDDTTFASVVTGKNLLNPNKGKLGYLDGVGGEKESPSFWITDYIPVKPLTLYSRPRYGQWVEYEEKGVINKITTAAFELTTQANTRFIRTHVPLNTLEDKTAFIIEGSFTGIAPYEEYIKIDRLMVDELITKNIWNDKTILWLGTSIPSGAGYPEMVAEKLGAKLINNAKGGGRVRAFKSDGSWESQNLLKFQFTLSKSDVIARYTPNLGKKVKEGDYLTEDASGVVLTQAMLDAFTVENYEALLLPYIAETDLFVLDFGINDRNGQLSFPFAAAAIAMYDRKEFAGAMGFLIKKIIEGKPNARIVIVSHHTSDPAASPSTDFVVRAQEDVAKFWGAPFMDISKISGTNHLTLNILSDGLHPVQRGLLANRYARCITNKLIEVGL